MPADGGAVAVEVSGKFVDAGIFAVTLSNLLDFIIRVTPVISTAEQIIVSSNCLSMVKCS